uniref:Uncharacterized protein n=1 Tax=Marmota marmota marmota TaxID=9994 RepID=A0A8C5YS90_MARMA
MASPKQKTKTGHKRTNSLLFAFFYLFFFLLLEIEPRALHMLSTCSTTELYPHPCPF